MRTFWQDLNFGQRLLRANPGFTVVAVITLALGIAANTTVFSWIDQLLWHPFGGATDSHQLAVLETISPSAPNGANQVSYMDCQDYRQNMHTISGLALHREDVFRLGDVADMQMAWGELVTGNYFAVLGIKPALGRMFTAEENGEQLGAYPVAVISYRLWRSRFHQDPAAIGQTVRINRLDFTVVGVAPPEFRGTLPGLAFDLWVPVTMGIDLGLVGDSTMHYRGDRRLYAVARLKPGVSTEEARTEAILVSRRLEMAFPATNQGVSATVLPIRRFHSAAPDLLFGPLRILMVIAILVLLIGCANVTNLLLARSIARRRELSVRLALGAGPGRLARQLVTESLLLSAAGGALGFFLAFLASDSLLDLVPKINAPIAGGFQMNARILGFTILVCVLASLLSSITPALSWFRADVNEALKEGGRGGSWNARSLRMRGVFVISEVAMATLALVGAGLLLRSLQNARAIYPGFDRQNVVLARFYPEGSGFSRADFLQFCSRLHDRLLANPEVLAASYADSAPLGSSAGPYSTVQIEGYVAAKAESLEINHYYVSPGYFGLLRTPLIAGRDFTLQDNRQAPPVLIVNRTFAVRYFHGANALGRQVKFRNQWHIVVGIAEDSKYFSIAEAARPHFFAPFLQQGEPDRQLFFYIKTAGDPSAVMSGLRRLVAEVNPNASAFDVMEFREWTEVTLLPQRAAASLLAVLGAVALILAAIGLYSVMAYAVGQRTQEIGIRMALGAEPRAVLRQILRQGLVFTGAGLAVGIALSLALTRLVSSMLVDVGAADPRTFAGAAVFLTLVALAASYIPARRATKVDPMVALHSE